MSENRPDLFAFFDAMNQGDFSYVDDMTEEELKGIAPFVLLMWVHGAKSDTIERVLLTNTYCNQYVFALSKHPRLLLKLFIASNMGIGKTRYSYKKSKQSKQSKHLKLIQEYYGCGYEESIQRKEMLSSKELKELESYYE